MIPKSRFIVVTKMFESGGELLPPGEKGRSGTFARIVAWLRRLVAVLAPLGYQEETGFHFGVQSAGEAPGVRRPRSRRLRKVRLRRRECLSIRRRFAFAVRLDGTAPRAARRLRPGRV